VCEGTMLQIPAKAAVTVARNESPPFGAPGRGRSR